MANPIIVVASVLKPVDDVRLYEKFALSLGQTNKYDINIIGFSTKNTPSQSNIKYYPIFKFRRMSIHRVLAPINYWICLRKLQPDLIIVTTAELLPVSCIYVKIILLTAKGQEADRERGAAVGATQYMTKPFDPDELLDIAKEMLGLTE